MRIQKIHFAAFIAAASFLFSGCGEDTAGDLSVANVISDQSLELRDRSKTVSIAGVFSSEAGNAITYAVTSKNSAKLTTSISGTTLTLTPLTTDSTVEVIVTATTTEASVSDLFVVTLPNSDMNATGARTTLAHAGLAESISGQGYEHTLTGSADKKCQNCHNDLYDTWKTSMHAKSWSDNIFQSKFQDFLRTRIAKIGVTSDIEMTVAKFKGVSKTCIKCHAPSALYANDWSITVETLADANYTGVATGELNTTLFAALKTKYESNLASTSSTFDKSLPASVIGVAKDANRTMYKVTYHIGHYNNREGINCATCHSMETIQMIQAGDSYTLTNDMRNGAIGAVVRAAGTNLAFDANGTTQDMNNFFRLWGPETYGNVTARDTKSGDGRYTYRKFDINGTGGKKHYTGGPFYGPYGVTGTSNSNEDDDTNRSAHALAGYVAKDNHFSKNAKGLCLSCHQRSAGAVVPSSSPSEFMELCSTWNAVSDGVGDNYTDSANSPKCTKCHMPRLSDKTVLHQWNKPNKLFPRDELLTGYFDPEDADGHTASHNPVVGKWMNDHGFIGANKQTGANYLNKLKSGFSSDLTTNTDTTGKIKVTATFANLTAHMFPGAHPMRRAFTRVMVTDADGNQVAVTGATGQSTFENVVNDVVPSNANDTVNTTGTGKGAVAVEYASTRVIKFPGQTPDLNGSSVTSQKFDRTSITYASPDGTISNREVNASGIVVGTVKNAAIVTDTNTTTFTRIYGHETGKTVNGTFIVRPGFDSNVVGGDNRLLPNEKETYTLTYDVTAGTVYTVTYKVYYMTKGANGYFPVASDGFLDSTINSSKKLLIFEGASHTESVTAQ